MLSLWSRFCLWIYGNVLLFISDADNVFSAVPESCQMRTDFINLIKEQPGAFWLCQLQS